MTGKGGTIEAVEKGSSLRTEMLAEAGLLKEGKIYYLHDCKTASLEAVAHHRTEFKSAFGELSDQLCLEIDLNIGADEQPVSRAEHILMQGVPPTKEGMIKFFIVYYYIRRGESLKIMRIRRLK